MGRFVPALISLDGEEKYVVYDTAEGMQKVSRVVSSGGSGGGTLVVHVEENEAHTTYVLDKTWNEILDAFESGIVPVLPFIYDDMGYEGFYYSLMSIWSGELDGVEGTVYGVNFAYFTVDEESNVGGQRIEFTTDSDDGYPESEIGGAGE